MKILRSACISYSISGKQAYKTVTEIVAFMFSKIFACIENRRLTIVQVLSCLNSLSGGIPVAIRIDIGIGIVNYAV